MRSSGPHSFQTRENSYKTMKNVKRQNFENLKTSISYNNLFELIKVMEHGSFQGKHKFHNFNKFTYICHNCYNCHNLLITSASTKAQGSRQVEWKNRKTHWYEAISSALNFRKSRRIAWFLMLLSSKIEEVSQNCFVFDVVNFEKFEEVTQNCFVFDVVNFEK